jgi:hypothetical protein
MNRTFSETKLEAMLSGLDTATTPHVYARRPVHMLTLAAGRFDAHTSRRMGEAALRSIDSYAPDFVSFARAMWLTGADTLPRYDDLAQELEFELIENPENVKDKNYAAWFAWTIYQRTIGKLHHEPVEELLIDLADNSGAAIAAAGHLAQAVLDDSRPPFTGVRLPSMEPGNARFLDLFLTALIEKTGGKLPSNFCITLPAPNSAALAALHAFLSEFERQHALESGLIKIEVTVASPRAIVDDDGRIVLSKLADAAGGRCISAHLDGDSFLSELNVPAAHRHARHEACNFARQIMHLALSPSGIGLSDSIVPSTALTQDADIQGVHRAWREHFNGITHSLIGGFNQGWDADAVLLPARYAAVYSFFIEAQDAQGKRFREFTGQAAANGEIEDASSAQTTLNFFYRALDCGALTEHEVSEATGLSAEELRCGSFAEIMKRRQYKTAAS